MNADDRIQHPEHECPAGDPLASCASLAPVSARNRGCGDGSVPPHAWDCPKIMKVDPDDVAWTCLYCGAIATTADLGVKPA
jgi:hypothetical protein